MATSALPSPGPTNGRNCYLTPAFSGVPKQGDEFKSGFLNTAFSRAHKWAELLHNPYMLKVPKQGDELKSG